MNVQNRVTAIDTKIQSQGSDKVGIRMGYDLYRELWKAGHITKEEFVVKGTPKLFPVILPAYKQKHAAWMDPDMADDDFEVGMPAT